MEASQGIHHFHLGYIDPKTVDTQELVTTNGMVTQDGLLHFSMLDQLQWGSVTIHICCNSSVTAQQIPLVMGPANIKEHKDISRHVIPKGTLLYTM